MNPTPYSDVNQVLDGLLSEMQSVLGSKLVGLYLYGSLVWGDFDHDISDMDMLAAVATDVDPQEFFALQHMHDTIAHRYPQWNDRIEVQYFSLLGLKTFRTQSSPMLNISPGEPFHRIEAGKEWLINWYFVQDYGVTLFGPPPQTLIDPISKAEFIQAARDNVEPWRDYVGQTQDSPGHQAYIILTLCRALYTHKHGTQVSKKQAALWTEKQFPQWSALIQNAFLWRGDSQHSETVETFPETVAFIHFMMDRIDREP
jgi:hypothetical protein